MPPCVSKIFEKLVFNHILNYLRLHSVITAKQSGFIPGDSCVNQLLHITHKIYQELDKNNSVRAVFLDFTKAFDKVSHKGLLYKLSRCGIKGNMLRWMKDYLSDRMQKVILNGKSSSWKKITAGVPQGSVLGPLCFLVYINDIVENINSHIFLFADNASLFRTVDEVSLHEDTRLLNEDLNRISLWANQWKIIISIPKTIAMIFSRMKQPPQELPLI